MPKFSEIPFYIIKEFFLQKEIDGSYKLPVVGQLPPSGTCTLHGQNTGISTLGGYGIEIYLKTSNNYYMLKGLYSVSSEDLISNKFYSREGVDDSFLNNGKTNKFVFQLLPSASDYRFRPSEFNMVELFPAPSDENYSGSDVYFRRGTLIYDYIISRGYDSFINVNKPFLYFGKLWKGEVEGTIEIDSNHFKDYVYRCLPTINRSDNYDEYIGVAFDGVYNKTYNMLKNLQTFPDAYEIDEKYLMYLRETFNVPSVGSDITERTYLKYIVSLLKRKGTYTYIYAIWKIVNQTSNTLNIYERWHDPLPPSSCPYPYFEDHLYTKNRLYHDTMLTYNPVPSGGAGYRYYRTTYPCNVFGGTYYGLDVPYPVYGFEDYAYDVSTVMATLSASTMTFDFDYLTEWLMMHNKFTPFIFGQMWVNDSGEFFQAQPGESFPLTENIYEFKSDVPVSGSGTLAVPDFVHSHPVKEEEWTIIHTLGVPSATLLGGGQYVNEIYPLVIVTDRDHKQIMPDRIYKYDEDTTIIEFDEYKVNGYVLFKRPDYEHVQHYPSDTWVVNHGLGDTILAQVYDDSWPNENVIQPAEIKSENNVATITFPVSCTGRAEICDVVTRPREWNFVHRLDSDEEFVMVQTWDENLYNFWPTETLSSGATCYQMKNTSPSSTHVYFDDWQPGYAMAASADYYHTQSIPATAWNIEHNLLTDWPVVNIIDESYDYLAPSAYTIEFIDENNLHVTFSVDQKGYAAIAIPDEIISVPVPISSSWFVHHNLFTDFNLITVWDGSTEKTILPTSIRHYKWANSIALEFDSDYYGYVSLKSATSASQYLQRVHNLGKILSTHVEIEIDLTNEPLEKNDIIYKDRLDKMITLWDYLRPVSRVYHYSMVISQELDFSGNKAALYPYSSDVNFTTKFLSTPIDPITSSFVEIIQNPTESVYILHNLKSLNVVIQCFDTNNNMIEPLECFPVNEDTSKITFEEPFTGTICATKAETVVDMSTYSISSGEYDDFYVWDVSAAPIDGKFDHIPQITNYDRYRVLPESIESQNPSSSKWPTVWFSPSSSPIIPDEKWIISGGHYIAVSGSKIEFFAPDDNVGIVNIIHNLDGNAFQVAVFNDSHELIYPENIHIYDNNRIQLQFDTSNLPLNGYAIVRKVSNEAYGTRYTFSHVKLGYGSSGKSYNPEITGDLENAYEETYIVHSKDIDSDPDYYYITINIDENIDYSVDEDNNRYGIREIGIFNIDGDLLFYTYCNLIEKPLGVSFKLYYKIRKRV